MKIFKYELLNVFRDKWLGFYALFFFLFTLGLLMFGGGEGKVIMSLVNISLFIIPLISLLYSSFYFYNGRTYRSLLLSTVVTRKSLYLSTYVSLVIGLVGSYILGTLFALLIKGELSFVLVNIIFLSGILSAIFIGIGLFIATLIEDSTKGFGITFLLFLYFSLVHDILVFSFIKSFSDYPIEIPTLILMITNPIDLIRVVTFMNLNFEAMMGYTGRVLLNFLTGTKGIVLSSLFVGSWLIIPSLIGIYVYKKKDLK